MMARSYQETKKLWKELRATNPEFAKLDDALLAASKAHLAMEDEEVVANQGLWGVYSLMGLADAAPVFVYSDECCRLADKAVQARKLCYAMLGGE